jgi:hypothetical protein
LHSAAKNNNTHEVLLRADSTSDQSSAAHKRAINLPLSGYFSRSARLLFETPLTRGAGGDKLCAVPNDSRQAGKMTNLIKQTALLCAFMLLAVTAALAVEKRQMSNEPLTFDKTQGKAPLSIAVTAPAELAELWTGWQKRGSVHGKWGDGFWIDWGDGTGDGDSSMRPGKAGNPAEIGNHTYADPGTYNISAGIYQFMPDDSHNIFWRGQATVTVQAK